MRSMFSVGFDREVFSVRHPSMGVSISQLETFWKANYPEAKAELKPFLTSPPAAPVPAGTPAPLSPTNLAVQRPPPAPAPAPSDGGGSSALLWVGGLAILGVGGWYVATHPKTFGFGKKK